VRTELVHARFNRTKFILISLCDDEIKHLPEKHKMKQEILENLTVRHPCDTGIIILFSAAPEDVLSVI
jgi:hypothetical protein